MATIKWNKKARQLFVEHVNYARQEFGMTTALRWFRKKNYIEARISRYPESYPLETLLCSKHRTYRRAILMKNFKIVYVYYPSSDTVRIVDIWDMRMNPKNLKQRIK